MSDSFQAVTKVITIDDDEDEDLEVVFCNLNQLHVHRNLKYHKLSQEIKLLKAMCTQTIPDEFFQFKEIAKKLGFQYGDDVFRSAWQRVMKKKFTKFNRLQNHKTPTVCMVRPLQSPATVSRPQAEPHQTHPSLSVTVTPPPHKVSPPQMMSTAIPVALVLNKSIQLNCSHVPDTDNSLNLRSTLETYISNKNEVIARYNSDKLGFSVSENTRNQTDNFSVKTKFSTDTVNSKTHRNELDVFSADVDKQTDNQFSIVSEYNQFSLNSSEKSKYSSQKCLSQQVEPTTLPNLTYVSSSNKISLSKRRTRDLDGIQNCVITDSFEAHNSTTTSEDNRFNENKRVNIQSSQNQKSSSGQIKAMNSQKSEQLIATSHVGVKAKIVKTKKISQNSSRKRLEKKSRKLSEAELKEFKAEQKKLKREFELQQMQKVSDRLVDILIPKYHNKDQNRKC